MVVVCGENDHFGFQVRVRACNEPDNISVFDLSLLAQIRFQQDSVLEAANLLDEAIRLVEEQWGTAHEDLGEIIEARGARIVNVDVTLVCERPRIGPHRAAMRERLAGLLGIAAERVSVKATTTERLGFTGRGEGLAAQATAVVALPRTA